MMDSTGNDSVKEINEEIEIVEDSELVSHGGVGSSCPYQSCNSSSFPSTKCICKHSHKKPKYKAAPVTPRNKLGRNKTCPCGSGKKYKKCCLLKREYTPVVR